MGAVCSEEDDWLAWILQVNNGDVLVDGKQFK